MRMLTSTRQRHLHSKWIPAEQATKKREPPYVEIAEDLLVKRGMLSKQLLMDQGIFQGPVFHVYMPLCIVELYWIPEASTAEIRGGKPMFNCSDY
jgi:hypothetical protein